MAPAEKKVGLTDKEAVVLALAWQCFKTTPEVDIEKLAGLAGYANPRSVSNLLSAIKKKISGFGTNTNANGGEGLSTPAKGVAKAKATPASRKRKVAFKADSDDDSATPTPTKRSRSRKAVLPKAAIDGEDSEADKKSSAKKDADDEFAED
ncbi:hypothetical protein F4820DRAFT_248529 [Hypoxylon rubiginosum]|uniref:Uncharacterized protein n=1 Tax=Hypoxylon rubiginosum TaxID=110542 RepID=A0ACB9Z411_9PEZI|nr:hypothetical protein F4820DRAFT_248529 [Hypoxylon rubiginosum]